LAAQARGERRVRAPAPIGLPGPQPALTRLVFTRDSITWGQVASVADLLQRVPGVYLWRGGWTGQPELPDFQGRAATSVEYFLDGLPYVPAGADSVGIDPSLFALSFLERVEIERWPGLLRVWLFTLHHDRLAPRSRIGVARGSADFARYQGSLERRTRSGLGFALAGDHLTVPALSGVRTGYRNTQLFVQGSYLPSDRWGLLAQVIRSRPNRAPAIGAALGVDTLSRGIPSGQRVDWQLRGMWRADTGALGARADLLIGRTSAGDSLTPTEVVNQAGVVASWRRPDASLSASAFYRSRWTSLDLRAGGGWNPIAPVAVALEGVYQRHDGGRNSAWVGLKAGVALPYGFRATEIIRLGSAVAAPAIATDPAQTLRDHQTLVTWELPWLTVGGGYARTAAFQPLAYQPYAAIPAVAPSSATEWLTLQGRLRPLSWISFEGWYSNPRGAVPEGIPPRHVLGSGEIDTRFLRLFPSGILRLKLRLSVEHWNDGVIGRDAFGDPVVLGQATYWRSLVQLAFGSLQLYWDRSNLRLTGAPYVPGLPIAGRPSEFGVRWEFSD
jgi:hypothetical protein